MPLRSNLPTQQVICGLSWARYEDVPPVNIQVSSIVVPQDTNVTVLLLIHFGKIKCPKTLDERITDNMSSVTPQRIVQTSSGCDSTSSLAEDLAVMSFSSAAAVGRSLLKLPRKGDLPQMRNSSLVKYTKVRHCQLGPVSHDSQSPYAWNSVPDKPGNVLSFHIKQASC